MLTQGHKESAGVIQARKRQAGESLKPRYHRLVSLALSGPEAVKAASYRETGSNLHTVMSTVIDCSPRTGPLLPRRVACSPHKCGSWQVISRHRFGVPYVCRSLTSGVAGQLLLTPCRVVLFPATLCIEHLTTEKANK